MAGTVFHKRLCLMAQLHLDTLCFALGRFPRNPWFHWIWFVQRVFLAKKDALVCGTRFVHWRGFCNTIMLISEKQTGISLGWSRSWRSVYGGLHQASERRFRKVIEQADGVWGFPGRAEAGFCLCSSTTVLRADASSGGLVQPSLKSCCSEGIGICFSSQLFQQGNVRLHALIVPSELPINLLL